MRISIENFKSIRRLKDFELKPFNIISGVNSSGKSSFFQLLLLLKQTVELESTNQHFVLDGEYYKVKSYEDILYKKDLNNKLEVSFLLNKADFATLNSPELISMFNHFEDYECLVEIKFDYLNNKTFVQEFNIVFKVPKGLDREQYLNCSKEDNEYIINVNRSYFNEELHDKKEYLTITDIVYSSIFPLYYKANEEVVELIIEEGEPDREIKKNEPIQEFFKINDIKILVQNFFTKISYIGPLREQPKDEYPNAIGDKGVGTKGEFVAQVLENHAEDSIQYYKLKPNDKGGIEYSLEEGSLLEGVKYWICDVLGIAKNIRTEKKDDVYKIWLTGHNGVEVTIKHVGFGISQVLPIIVEGLRMPKGGTFILEQPEVHLHPKVQSLLYDFLYSLTLQNKMVIVETHSSHFITRMRRRIAEDESNGMDDRIKLTFVENNIFRTIGLDSYGTLLNYFPKDFIEESSTELHAIIKAQMRKRKQNG